MHGFTLSEPLSWSKLSYPLEHYMSFVYPSFKPKHTEYSEIFHALEQILSLEDNSSLENLVSQIISALEMFWVPLKI